MRGNLHVALALALSLMGSTDAQSKSGDLIEFPATGELDIVFPRNETYAVEAPFPVIFGFHNAPALISYPTSMNWELSCGYGSLFGIGSYDGQRNIPPPSDPFFFINASDVLRKPSEGDQWKYFRGETDSCVLTYEFRVSTTCEPLPNGGRKIMTNYLSTRKGNVTFTLKPGGTPARDAITNYKGCAVSGSTVKIQSNMTGCPQIAEDSAPEPQPCDLDVEGAASSLAAAVVSPTTSLTALTTKTTSTAAARGATTTRSGISSAATGGSSGGGDGGSSGRGGDDSWATPRFAVSGGVVTVVVAVVVGGLMPFIL